MAETPAKGKAGAGGRRARCRIMGAGAGCAVAAAVLEAFEPATRGVVGAGLAGGSRFKGSIRDGLNDPVEPGFASAHGSRDQYRMV
jgi:hypothetical protein